MTRVAAKVFVAVLFSAAVLVGGVGGARAGDGGKCTIATKPDTETGKACAKGGRAEAKRVMKKMVKIAKGNGQKFTCDGCHKDLDNFTLTANATEEYKKLVAAQTKK